MENQTAIDFDQTRILNLLHQVKEVNKMIRMHNTPPIDSFMITQYKHQKNKFLVELKEILSGFEIEVNITTQEKAA